MIIVLDACAMIAFLRGETGSEVVEGFLVDEDISCLAHAVNLCEVYYDFLRAEDEETAKSAIEDLQALWIGFQEDMDMAFWQQVCKYKVHHRLSLADCFAVALTSRVDGELATSDHHEFDPIDIEGVCRIKFIR